MHSEYDGGRPLIRGGQRFAGWTPKRAIVYLNRNHPRLRLAAADNPLFVEEHIMDHGRLPGGLPVSALVQYAFNFQKLHSFVFNSWYSYTPALAAFSLIALLAETILKKPVISAFSSLSRTPCESLMSVGRTVFPPITGRIISRNPSRVSK